MSDTERIDDGEWHHVVARKNGTDVALCVDGFLYARDDVVNVVGAGDVGDTFYAARCWQGLLDEGA